MLRASYVGYLVARQWLVWCVVLTQDRAHPVQNARRATLPDAPRLKKKNLYIYPQSTNSWWGGERASQEGRGVPRMGGESPGRGGPSPRRGGEGGDGLALFVFIYGYPCQKFSAKGRIARACKRGVCKERLRRVKPHYSVIRCNYM